MKYDIIIKMITVTVILALTACSSVDDITSNYPYISKLTNTECIKAFTHNSEIDSDTDHGTFKMTLEGTPAKCKFTSLYYPCDFGKVNIKVSYKEGVLSIVEYPSSDKADCRCETDATFIVENIPYGDFILKIYHGDINGKFNEDSPKYIGKIELVDVGLSIPY